MQKWIQLRVSHDFPLEQFEAVAGYRGCFEDNDSMVAYFDFDEQVFELLKVFAPDIIDQTAWKESWKEFFVPVHVAGFTVVPPWRSSEGTIVIDPARGFGTGHHETTQLAAQKMIDMLNAESLASMLDVGTGSGILTIMARKTNKDIALLGIDNDADAIENARHNAVLNGVDPSLFQLKDIAHIDTSYDLVVANIISSVLLSLRSDLLRLTGKYLVLTGILQEEKEKMIQAFSTDTVIFSGESYRLNEWISLTFQRRGYE